MHNYTYLRPDISREGRKAPRAIVFHANPAMGPIASATADAAPFHLVGTSAALTLDDNVLGGRAKLVSNTTNPAVLQGNGEPFKLRPKTKTYFEADVMLADFDGTSFFVGLAITNVDPFTTSLTDYVGFFTTDGVIKIGCGKNNNNVPGSGTSGETDQAAAIAGVNQSFADNTLVTLAFIAYGTDRIKFFVNEKFAGTITSDIPDDEFLTVTFANKGSAETAYFDNILCVQDI